MMYSFIYALAFPYLILRCRKNNHMLQQNFYNENNRYLKWGNNNLDKVFKILDIVLLTLNLLNLWLKNNFLIYFNIFYLLLFAIEYNVLSKEQVKISLKITSRIKRLFVTNAIIYLLPIVIYVFIKNIYIYFAIYSLLISINFYVVYLSNIINIPIEKLVFLHYKNMAIKKINNMSGLEVIGITGSYGKTSSKNILNDILKIRFNPIATPYNYNTQYGLIITINNYIDNFNDIFIAEMGAFKRGRIKLLCDLVKPKYAIITSIGEAHLETFGSRENIQKAKFELVESLPSDGVAILNKDDFYQVSYKIKNNCKVIWISIDAEDSDVKASNINMDSNGMTFDVYFKSINTTYKFKTKLLGKANIYNILSSLAFGIYKGMTLEELSFGVNKIKPIPHRLELKEMSGNKIIIDDAYNSNPVGSKMALDVLNLMDGIKIVVTPGMIELGEEQYELNKKFGKYISKVADFTILVGKNQTKPILDGLREENYDDDKIYVINDVKEAFKIVDSIKKPHEKAYVLLENDLPDIFNEK